MSYYHTNIQFTLYIVVLFSGSFELNIVFELNIRIGCLHISNSEYMPLSNSCIADLRCMMHLFIFSDVNECNSPKPICLEKQFCTNEEGTHTCTGMNLIVNKYQNFSRGL